MRGHGHQVFVDELTQFVAGAADQRVTAIAERVAGPLRVAVNGRRGVGCATVARVLDRVTPGITVTPPERADVALYVTVEVLKPEDREALAAARRPVVVVLNKADLAGFGCAAQARCAQLAALIGVPVEPMIGLLAAAALDDLDAGSWAALRALAAHPGGSQCLDSGSEDFLAAQLPVPTEDRERLLQTLDLFGTALGIAAARRGKSAAQIRTLWRRVSGVDAVIDKLIAAGAEAYYRRVLRAVTELEALAVSDPDISEFLSRDDTVIARMAAAIDVVEAAGLDLGPAAPLPRAVHWHRYSGAPVCDVQRACGADIARGSLRLWSRAGEAV
ncbi:hypothetical protein [Mycobacterium riyadhense]|uniref:Uncharacterized protein n=1 Tax=Mycobacterium riyadhense TaxID=486698 RepID=A0A1X2DFT5_9MYCO|nr:hypothetical protein [Mycobacterium riyadhense]MCV7146838.1 hypothetical protein [Mycobacterium riyadhense]ORW86844.1 hypothetical protein AWC22_10270 [Mycobacterium riyadhense]VTP02224.1 hypothetical protein BIN_B_04416 [Mycobacterium riyadhense]